nr:primosomal protein N' [Lachnospiraceae bacterium]
MQKKYADVIIDISHEKVDRPFQYKIPERLAEHLKIGMCVRIPFGKGNRLRTGYVVDMTDETDYPVEKLKEIVQIDAGNVPMEARSIELAWWMKNRYGGTMIQAMKTVLPVKQEMKPVMQREVSLAVTKEEACSYLAQAKAKQQVGKVRLLEALLEGATVNYSVLTAKLSVSPQTIKSMEAQGVLRIESFQEYRNPIRFPADAGEKKHLTEEQQQIVDTFLKDYDNGIKSPSLLHGVTGSGKTEVYMELIAGMLERGKQTIVLIPEIALTYQTVARFYRRFGDVVSVVNSRLSAGEKYDQFQRAREGKVKVMIGPRSALFTPFEHLGLIVIDEEHEPVYKSDTTPRYHAREVAVRLAEMTDAAVFMGSATPSLDSNFRALNGEFRKFVLSRRIGESVLPRVQLVDMCEELKAGNMSMFSRDMQQQMQQTLAKGEQIMLFLNRRGLAGFVSCKSCGHVLRCPHCDVSLSEHKNKMICHYCGYEAPKVTKCPECGSKYIYGFRAGTEKVEEKIKEMFPNARVLRMDADTTRKKGDYENILAAFSQGEADILIGTQMIVKGHDFKNVTMVGVIAADLSLHASDYRAGERTFQLLAQAVGRAGRRQKSGIAIVQTYQPDHYSLQHCVTQDYDAFYAEEIAYRNLMEYPPAAHMMAILLSGKDEQATETAAKSLAERLRQCWPQSAKAQLRIIGPAPAGIGKINDHYRRIVYLKCASDEELICAKDEAEHMIKEQEEMFRFVSVHFDMDPVQAY